MQTPIAAVYRSKTPMFLFWKHAIYELSALPPQAGCVMNTPLRTGCLAGAAPDALRAVGRLIDRDVHGAGLLANLAADARLFVHLKAVQ